MDNNVDLSQVKWDSPSSASGIDLAKVKWDSPQEDSPSPVASFFRSIMRNSPLEQAKTAGYMYENADKMPPVSPGENIFQYQKRVNKFLEPREKEESRKGTVAQFQPQIEAAMIMGGAANPVGTAKALLKFTALDKATDAVGLDPNKIQNPTLRDAADIAKFGIEGGVASKRWPMIEKTPEAKLSEYSNAHRDILSPDKGTLKKIEIKSDKDLGDLTKLAAQTGVIYGKTPEGKLDTRGAIDKVNEAVAPKYAELDQMLSNDPTKRFDLKELAKVTKSQLAARYTNAKELQRAREDVDEEINAEIERHGQEVDGTTLNNIKKGMWSKSFNVLEPNSNDVARQIGYNAKNFIEDAYPKDNVKELNADIGKHLDLVKLLENSHGKVVKAGKVGRYAAQIIGGMAGHAIPVPVVGTLAGAEVGGRLSDFLNSPERISTNIANKVKELNINEKPKVSTSKKPTLSIGYNPVSKPAYLAERESMSNKISVPQGEAKIIPPEKIEISSVPRKERVVYNPKAPEGSIFDVSSKTKDSNKILNNPILIDSNPLKSRISSIPEFKNTEEALRFGQANKNNSVILKALQDKYNSGLAESEKIKSLGDKATDEQMSQAFYNAQRNQLYREALEAAKGKTKSIIPGLIGGTLAAGLLMNSNPANAANNINIKKINMIESSGNPKAIGDNGNAFGLNQIHLPTLANFNKRNKKNYTREDLMDRNKNNEVADWYFNREIPRMLKAKGHTDNIKNRIVAYNAGITHVGKSILPKKTFEYIQKYNKMK